MNWHITSAIETVGLPIDETELLYFEAIDCEMGKDEYARSTSLRGCTFDGKSELGNAFE